MSRPTILYIEPDEDSRVIHQQLLTAFGYRAICAPTARIGLELVRTLHPDVIITELFSSPPGGFSIVRTLKAEASTRGVPVVVLSAYVMLEDREGALQAGATAFLAKPCPTRRLEKVLAGLTGMQVTDRA